MTQNPAAWLYELADTLERGEYKDWNWHLSVDKPNAPAAGIRNLQPLYATTRELGAEVTVNAGDYSYSGFLVAEFNKRGGATRFVVEDSNGRLFIHNPFQIGPRQIADNEMRLCHCDLTGDLEVVTRKTCCELCNMESTYEINGEQIKKAFKFLSDRWAMLIKASQEDKT